MNGVPHMIVMRSISLYGLSDIRLAFEESTDAYFARQVVFERLADAQLPSGVTPSMAPLFSQAARTTAAARAADTPVGRCARTKGTRISTPPARAAQMRTRCESCVPIQGMRARETMSAPKIAPRVLAA